jgi:hypothetical protein
MHERLSRALTKGMTWMEIDLARDLVRTAFRISADLQNLLPEIRKQCPDAEYRELARGIAQAIDSVGVALTNKALSAHPELKQEIDAKISESGRYR